MTNLQSHIVISADGHCGADLWGYKPYLEKRFHDEFDAWATHHTDEWANLDDDDDEFRLGVSSFASDVNWLSDKRTDHLESQGIVGEVLFPNTTPPFFPGGTVGPINPGTDTEYEYRFAGLQAHNRWLVDFCNQLPGRRAGVAQIFLNDVDRAIEEVRRAKEGGLSGVLLPSDHMLGLSNLYYPRYEPFWAVCEELNMPVHRHGVVPSEAASVEHGEAPPAIGLTEVGFFTHRPLVHLILAGVFDRYPDLKLVMTEAGCVTSIHTARQLDGFVHQANTKGTISNKFGGSAIGKLMKLPSEYLSSNVYYGSFFSHADMAARDRAGTLRMMWGSDYPHHEGTSPYTQQALRLNFGGLPDDDVRAMLCGTAIDVYGFDVGVLRLAADRVGPTPEVINRPGALQEIPADARGYCPTFADGAFGFAGSKS